ncbi:amino acid/polyamine transporter I [Aspergillus unguis]
MSPTSHHDNDPAPKSAQGIEIHLENTNAPSPAQLPRSLSWLGAIGLAFTITNSWKSYAATFGAIIIYGGGVTVLFAVLIAALAQWVILLGVCELVSAFPSSGGCYHYTYILAPKSTRKFASFTVGIINLLGFWIGGVAAAIFTTISIFGIVEFATGFVPRPCEVYGGFVGVVLLSLLPILTIPASKTKHLTTLTLTLSLTCLVIFIIVLAAMTRTRTPSNLTLHSNRSGYSDPVGWLLSASVGMYSFSATGTVVHVAEEVPRPGRGIPLAINTTMAVGIITTIPFVVVLLLGIHDIQAVQEAWIPSLEAFYQATGCKAAAVVLQGLLVVLFYTVVSTQWISVSRIAWSLARDNALPYSPFFSQIHPHFNFPLNTTLLSATFFILFGTIYMWSTTAFNSFVNMASLFVNIAFTVPQGILLCRRRYLLPADREFNLNFNPGLGLGRRWTGFRGTGYLVNAFSVCWLVFVGVLFCFPTRIPTQKGEMNYGSVVLVGLFALIMGMYCLVVVDYCFYFCCWITQRTGTSHGLDCSQ